MICGRRGCGCHGHCLWLSWFIAIIVELEPPLNCGSKGTVVVWNWIDITLSRNTIYPFVDCVITVFTVSVMFEPLNGGSCDIKVTCCKLFIFVFMAHRIVQTIVQHSVPRHVSARRQFGRVTDRHRSRDDRRSLEVARRCPDLLHTADPGHENDHRPTKFLKVFPGFALFLQHQVTFSDVLVLWFSCKFLPVLCV